MFSGKFYFEYPADITKFIQCDIWGHAWVRDCRTGQEWVQSEETCITSPGVCRHHSSSQPYLLPHHCDPHKYIQCATDGRTYEMHCQPNYLFLPTPQTCAPIGFPGTESLVYTCNGAHQSYFTQQSQIYIGTTVTSGPGIGYTYATELWKAPCTPENVAARQLYFPYALNRHQYIQCDLNGRQYLKDCSSYGLDFYDPYTHTCVDGPVTPEPVIGG